MKVVFSSKMLGYIESLIPVLYEKGYFSFKEAAKKYVDELYDDIATNLPTKVKKAAPTYFDRYGKGMYYATFTKNKNTQWYVFFRISSKSGEDIYKVRYITNNHLAAQHFNN